MIAKTALGNNLLGLGLLSHLCALVIAITPLLEEVGAVLYLIATLFLVLGLYSQWNAPGKDSRFYTACAAATLPLVGPFVALKMVYFEKRDERPAKEHWITSVFALRIHPAVLLVWSVALAITVAVTFQQHDRYFANRPSVHTSMPK